MNEQERLDSIEDALDAGAITLRQAVVLLYDAYAHDTYCETDGAGRWAVWLGDRRDPRTGTRGVRVDLPADDDALYGAKAESERSA